MGDQAQRIETRVLHVEVDLVVGVPVDETEHQQKLLMDRVLTNTFGLVLHLQEPLHVTQVGIPIGVVMPRIVQPCCNQCDWVHAILDNWNKLRTRPRMLTTITEYSHGNSAIGTTNQS
jgi:hypothetical protein